MERWSGQYVLLQLKCGQEHIARLIKAIAAAAAAGHAAVDVVAAAAGIRGGQILI